MTEQPNTAAIREGSAAFPDDLLWHRTQTLALCNALDAARAELNARPHDACLALLADAVARAEAAEARIRRLQLEEDAALTKWREAEARIAAALEILDRRDRFGSTLPHENWVDTTSVRRALTEGTGQ